MKVITTLRQDIRVERDPGEKHGQLYRHVNENHKEMYILVPAIFQDGDKVRVTVEIIERPKKKR